jgi:hypothetical protein
MRYSFLILPVVFLFTCSVDNKKKDDRKKEDKPVRDGIAKAHYPNGRLRSEVPMKDGKRHGLAVEYYNSGKKYQEIHYVNGKHEGISRKYYDTGGLFEETPHDKGEIHGVRKRYHKNGKLSAEAPYHYGYPCMGLKEYLADGSPRSKYPTIVIEEVDNLLREDRYILRFRMSDNSKFASFYIGALSDNCISESLEKVPASSKRGVGEFSVTIPKGMFVMKEINVVAKVKTSLDNYYITQRKYNLSIENR